MRRAAAVATAGIFLLAACSRSSGARLPRSMKGYELYSFRVDVDWNYTLITGTDREKTFAELSAAGGSAGTGDWVKLTARGFEKAGQLVARLPPGEHVVWQSRRPGGLSFPPEPERRSLIDQARAAGIELRLLD